MWNLSYNTAKKYVKSVFDSHENYFNHIWRRFIINKYRYILTIWKHSMGRVSVLIVLINVNHDLY